MRSLLAVLSALAWGFVTLVFLLAMFFPGIPHRVNFVLDTNAADADRTAVVGIYAFHSPAESAGHIPTGRAELRLVRDVGLMLYIGP